MSSEWAMVCITAVYVVATIFICYFNAQTVKAANNQVAEMKSQEKERYRPRITIEIIYINKSFLGFRLRNSGGSIANNVSLNLADEFIDKLPTPQFQNLLRQQRGKKCIIAVNGYYDIYFGDNQYLKSKEKPDACGTITYTSADESEYSEKFCIDLKNYSTIFSVDSNEDKIRDLIKNQNQSIKGIADQLSDLNKNITIVLTNISSQENPENIK